MCMVICMSLCWCMLCRAVGWSDKCHMKKCFFQENKAIGCMTFSSCPTCQPGRIVVVYWYESLSGFLIVLPYLVFTQFSTCCILLLPSLVLVTVLYMCSCLLSCGLFFWLLFIMCTLSVIDIALDSPVWIWHWIVLMCSRITSNGSVCLLACFAAW